MKCLITIGLSIGLLLVSVWILMCLLEQQLLLPKICRDYLDVIKHKHRQRYREKMRKKYGWLIDDRVEYLERRLECWIDAVKALEQKVYKKKKK